MARSLGFFLGMRSLVSLTTACSLLAAEVAAYADAPTGVSGDASQDLSACEEAYANLKYAEANKLAQAVLDRGGLTHAQLVAATRILALTHGFLDNAKASTEAFIKLLNYEPDFQVDANLGPKVGQPFVEARGYWRNILVRPGLDATTVLAPSGGTARATLKDPTHIVKTVRFAWRWGGAGEFTSSSAPAAESVEAKVAAAPAGTSRFDYYVQALDDRSRVVFEVGSSSSPKSATVIAAPVAPAPPPSKPVENKSIFGSGVFWTVVGVAVVGGTAATYFALRKPREEIEPPTHGTLTPTFTCGFARCD